MCVQCFKEVPKISLYTKLNKYCIDANSFFNLKVILEKFKTFFKLISEIHIALLYKRYYRHVNTFFNVIFEYSLPTNTDSSNHAPIRAK